MQRDNLFYIVLGLIAIVLIGVTIGLQLMLLSGRSSNQTAAGDSSLSAESNIVNSGQTGATTGSDDRAVSMVINTPTSTVIVVEVQTNDSTDEPTATPMAPTSTPLSTSGQSGEAASGNEGANSGTEESAVELSQPIAASVNEPTAVPTESPPPTATALPTLPPTDTPIVSVDFVFSYVDGRTECALVTEIVASLFETWGWSTRLVRFGSMTAFFAPALYKSDTPLQPDLAFCYRDPEDREQFLSQNGTNLELVSSGYTTIDEQKYYVIAHSGLPSKLRYENPCVLNFLKELSLEGDSLKNVSSASEWTAQNIELVQSWGTCEATSQQ